MQFIHISVEVNVLTAVCTLTLLEHLVTQYYVGSHYYTVC